MLAHLRPDAIVVDNVIMFLRSPMRAAVGPHHLLRRNRDAGPTGAAVSFSCARRRATTGGTDAQKVTNRRTAGIARCFLSRCGVTPAHPGFFDPSYHSNLLLAPISSATGARFPLDPARFVFLDGRGGRCPTSRRASPI